MPVVSVCPVHGAFESIGFSITNATDVTLEGLSESCPRCGRLSPTMSGTFDFDADGLARAISAPGWSLTALRAVQNELTHAARALGDAAYSDDRAYALFNAKLDAIAAQGDANAAALVALIPRKASSRKRLAHIVAAVMFVLGAMANVDGAVHLTADVITTVVDQLEQNLPPTMPPTSSPPQPSN